MTLFFTNLVYPTSSGNDSSSFYSLKMGYNAIHYQARFKKGQKLKYRTFNISLALW